MIQNWYKIWTGIYFLPRKRNFHYFFFSVAVVTLEFVQVHKNWYDGINLKGRNGHENLDHSLRKGHRQSLSDAETRNLSPLNTRQSHKNKNAHSLGHVYNNSHS